MSRVPQSTGANLSAHTASELCPQDSRGQLMDALRRQLGRWEAASAAEDALVFSCGAAAIDRLLPHGGLRHGMLIEWIAGEAQNDKAPSPRPSPIGRGRMVSRPSPSGRGNVLGLLAAREACREGGALVVIDRRQTFYPPAAAAWGIDLDRLIVIHPQNARDELWAAVQALRSPAVAAMWAPIDRLDSRAFRRLQLAAQAGRTLGVLMRPASARGQPSWANVTLEVWSRVESQGSRAGILALDSRPSTLDFSRRIQVRVLRCHPGHAGGSATLEIDDAAYTVREASSNYDTHPLSVVSELGDSADHARSAQA
jgi:protein ImuA